jgi:hypothetical protein
MSTKNTGYKIYTKLKYVTDDANEYPLDVNGQRTATSGLPQHTKNNTFGDPNYVPPVYTPYSCPLPPEPLTTPTIVATQSPTQYTYNFNFVVTQGGGTYTVPPSNVIDIYSRHRINGGAWVVNSVYRIDSGRNSFTESANRIINRTSSAQIVELEITAISHGVASATIATLWVAAQNIPVIFPFIDFVSQDDFYYRVNYRYGAFLNGSPFNVTSATTVDSTAMGVSGNWSAVPRQTIANGTNSVVYGEILFNKGKTPYNAQLKLTASGSGSTPDATTVSHNIPQSPFTIKPTIVKTSESNTITSFKFVFTVYKNNIVSSTNSGVSISATARYHTGNMNWLTDTYIITNSSQVESTVFNITRSTSDIIVQLQITDTVNSAGDTTTVSFTVPASTVIYNFAGTISQGYSTASSACSDSNNTTNVYSESGTMDVGERLYYNSSGTSLVGTAFYNNGNGWISVSNGVIQSNGDCSSTPGGIN